MPLNERKIINIILEECKTVEERCEGYQEELVDVVTDIITAERQHRVQGTNIQKKINDMCNATGRFLAERQAQSNTAGEDA
jgi:ribosomal protein L4